MKALALLAILLCSLSAAEPKKPAAKPTAKPVVKAQPKLEVFLLLPEPKAMRTGHSITLGDAQRTVFTPAKETAEKPGCVTYTKEDFAKLGISPESFAERAQARAEVRLAALQPEFIKDDQGKTRYAVYRSDSPTISALLVAPSLGATASKLFGGDVWAATPDRHSLYLFPAKPEEVEEFTSDLAERYSTTPYAASCELFLVSPGRPLKVVAQFAD
jgi:hypothetical protein